MLTRFLEYMRHAFSNLVQPRIYTAITEGWLNRSENACTPVKIQSNDSSLAMLRLDYIE